MPSSVPFSGTTVAANVSTTRDCAWNITTDGSWIQINPNQGQGSGSVTIAVAQNPASSRRSATISINNTPTTISEDAAPPPPPPTPPAPPNPTPNPTPNPAPNPNPNPEPSPSPQPNPSPAPTPPPSPQPTPISFKGTIANLAGTCPTLTFNAAGHSVRTDSQTQFNKGTCGDMHDGVDVVIDGELQPSGVVQAGTIQLKKK